MLGSEKRRGWAILKAWEHGAFCQLCGGPLRLDTYGGTADDSTTLDHIEFWSHGGANSYANVQLAHRKCNNDRRAPCLTENQIAQLPPAKRRIVENRRSHRKRERLRAARPATTQPWRCAKCDRGAATRQQAYDCCQYGWRTTG